MGLLRVADTAAPVGTPPMGFVLCQGEFSPFLPAQAAPALRISPVRSQKCCRAPRRHRGHPTGSCGEPGGAEPPCAMQAPCWGQRPRAPMAMPPPCHCTHQSVPLGTPGRSAGGGPFLRGSGLGTETPWWAGAPGGPGGPQPCGAIPRQRLPAGQCWASQSGSVGKEKEVRGHRAVPRRAVPPAAPGLTGQLAVDLLEHAADRKSVV